MPELNLDINYHEHVKTRRLMARLGPQADVLPVRLWCYTAKHYAKDGRLVGHTDIEIESAINWWGEKGVCVAAMLDIGFIETEKNTFRVHDWKYWSGHLAAYQIRARKAAKARWSKGNGKPKPDATSNATSISKQCPNHTNQTNSTELNQPMGTSGRNGVGGGVAAHGTGVGGNGVEAAFNDAVRRSELTKIFERIAASNPPGINESVRENWMIRPDVKPEKVSNAWASISARSGLNDPVGMLVTTVDPQRKKGRR